jgi:hypothetical protein
LKGLRIELADHFLSDRAVRKLDKSESTWTTRVAIHRHGNVGGFGDGREMGSEIPFARAVGKVPDEQTDCQCLLVKDATR